MRPFAAVERFFERLFERPSARLFHSPLQPVQIQRRLERALDTGRVFSDDRAYVPNRFEVLLNPDDAEAFDESHRTLEEVLAESLHARARARGYRLLARPVVTIHVSSSVRRGDIDVRAEALDRRQLKQPGGHEELRNGPAVTGAISSRFATASPSGGPLIVSARAGVASRGLPIAPVGALPGEDRAFPLVRPASPGDGSPGASIRSGTLNVRTAGERPSAPPSGSWTPVSPSEPPVRSASDLPEVRPIAVVEVRTDGRLVAARPFTGGTLRVGRTRDNELVLIDDRVSRHHGRLTARQGVVVYTDLRSTNGSYLNGTRVREIVLGSGDVVRLGNSTLTIQSHT